MKDILIFILGLIFGGSLGLFISCLCISSKNSDIEMYENIKDK